MKRLRYVTILIVCILLLLNAGAQTPMNSSVIGIQYVGPSDKPVTPLIIAESREDADLFKKTILKISDLEMTDVHVVSPALMKDLVAAVEENQKGRAETRNPQATAVVLFTVVTNDQATNIHLDRSDGIETLGRLANISKGSPALEVDIAHFQRRISP